MQRTPCGHASSRAAIRPLSGAQSLTKGELKQDPLSGHLFVFVNRRGGYLKCLYWDRTGFCLWAKRLERGRFVSDWARVVSRELDWTGLKLLLEGIEPGRRMARFERQERTLEQSIRV